MKTSQVFRASFQSNLCKIRIFFVVVAVIPDNILRNHFILGVAHSHLGAAVHMILLLNTGPFKGLVSRDAYFTNTMCANCFNLFNYVKLLLKRINNVITV
jgi:hypothetical protein